MDERAVKRLLIIVAVSIILIFVFKMMLSKTIINLNQAAAEKKQAAKPPAPQEEAVPTADAEIIPETPAVSSTSEVASSAALPVSGVTETQ